MSTAHGELVIRLLKAWYLFGTLKFPRAKLDTQKEHYYSTSSWWSSPFIAIIINTNVLFNVPLFFHFHIMNHQSSSHIHHETDRALCNFSSMSTSMWTPYFMWTTILSLQQIYLYWCHCMSMASTQGLHLFIQCKWNFYNDPWVDVVEGLHELPLLNLFNCYRQFHEEGTCEHYWTRSSYIIKGATTNYPRKWSKHNTVERWS